MALMSPWPSVHHGSPQTWPPTVPHCGRPESARRSRPVALFATGYLPCPASAVAATGSQSHTPRLPAPPALLQVDSTGGTSFSPLKGSGHPIYDQRRCDGLPIRSSLGPPRSRHCALDWANQQNTDATPRSSHLTLEWVQQQIKAIEQRRAACEKQKQWLSEFRHAFNEEALGVLVEDDRHSEWPVPDDEVDAFRYWLERFGVDQEDRLHYSPAMPDKMRCSILESEQLALKKKMEDLRSGRLSVPEADVQVQHEVVDRNRGNIEPAKGIALGVASRVADAQVHQNSIERRRCTIDPNSVDAAFAAPQHADVQIQEKPAARSSCKFELESQLASGATSVDEDVQAAASCLRHSAHEPRTLLTSAAPASVDANQDPNLPLQEDCSSTAVFKMLESTIHKLDKDRASLEAAKESLEEDRQELTREVRALGIMTGSSSVDFGNALTVEQDLEEARSELQAAKALSQQSSLECTQLFDRNAELKQDLQSAKALSQQSSLECTQLFDRNAELKQEAAVQHSEIEQLRVCLAESRRRAEEIGMDKQVSVVNSSVSQNRRIFDLERDLVGNECAKLKSRILENQLVEQQSLQGQRLAELEAQLTSARTREHEYVKETSAQRNRILQLKQSQGMHQSDLEVQLRSASLREDEHVKESAAQCGRILQLEELLATAQADAGKLVQLENRLSRSHASEELLECQTQSHMQHIAELDGGAKRQVSIALMDDLEHQLAQSRAMNEMYAHEVVEKQQSVSVLMEQLNSYRAVQVDIDKKHQMLVARVSELEQERDDARSLKKVLAERNKTLGQQLARAKQQAARADTVEQQLTRAKQKGSRADTLEQQLSQAKHQAARADVLERVRGVHVQECKEYREQVAELGSELVESQSSLQRLGVQHDMHVQRGVELEKELAGARLAKEQHGHQSNALHQRNLELERKLIDLSKLDEERERKLIDLSNLEEESGRKLTELSNFEDEREEAKACQLKVAELERELMNAVEAEENALKHVEVHQMRGLQLEGEMAERKNIADLNIQQHDDYRAEIVELSQRSDALGQHVAGLESELRRMRHYENAHDMFVRKHSDLEASLKVARETEQRLRRQDITHKATIRKLESQLNLPPVKMALISSMYDDGDDTPVDIADVGGPPLQLFPSC